MQSLVRSALSTAVSRTSSSLTGALHSVGAAVRSVTALRRNAAAASPLPVVPAKAGENRRSGGIERDAPTPTAIMPVPGSFAAPIIPAPLPSITQLLRRPAVQLLVTTNKDCPLCDQLWSQLQRLQKQREFLLSRREVDSSGSVRGGFSEFQLPVVTVNGETVGDAEIGVDMGLVRHHVDEYWRAVARVDEIVAEVREGRREAGSSSRDEDVSG